MIISLSGYARSGKDTIGKIIKELDPSYKIVGFSDALKEVAQVITGIPASKWDTHDLKDTEITGYGMTGRQFLQKLGTEAMRNNFHTDVWVKALFSKYRKGDNWVITDCRFLNEAEWVRKYNGLVVRVVRKGISPVNAHLSETALDGYDFDAHIVNDGTLDDLRESVIEFYEGTH